MKQRPNNYEALQRDYSKLLTSDTLAEGARDRVRSCLNRLDGIGMPVNPVLVVGCHAGYELAEFSRMGDALGIDAVPEFVDASVAMRGNAFLTEVEDLDADMIGGLHNVYASYVLEHCWDLTEAVASIRAVAKDWVWVSTAIRRVPRVRPGGAVMSPYHDHRDLLGMFPEFEVAFSTEPRYSAVENFHVLFLRR